MPVDLPPRHCSDHRALVVRIWGRWGLKRYVRERETLPVQPPAAGERTEGEEMFAKLAGAIEKVPKREWEENAWIRPGTGRRSTSVRLGRMRGP